MIRTSWIRAICICASVAILAGAQWAQTTHTVNLQSVTFVPNAVTVDVGDTVQWIWISGFHNVESGLNGIPDGNFTSGVPVSSPATFSVTFDQAFLNANPVPGNLYDYYCIVHLGFNMVGTVKVNELASSTFRNDAGNTNLATFVTILPPVIGGTWAAQIDVSSHAGATSAFIIGYGTSLEFPLNFGVLLINIADPAGELINLLGVGGGVITFSVPVPNDTALCGFELSTQGVVLGGGLELTNAQDLVLGV